MANISKRKRQGNSGVRIKICGLKSPEDIRMINTYRPDYCGFIINFPKSHRSRSADQVRALVAELDRSRITPVGVFVDEPLEHVTELLRDGTIEIAQLHGKEDEAYIRKLQSMTGKPVIKAFQIKNAEDIHHAIESPADYILLDKGQGSGETFDWSLPGAIERPWFLAGGLNDENLAQAIERLRPWAVDLSSSVETEQRKDAEKIRRVIEIVRDHP